MNYKAPINSGFGQIADSMKMLLYKQAQEIFEKIDFGNDVAFTEPLLFAYFNLNLIPSLDQLLWSYFKKESKSGTFEVISDKEGIFYIPEYGYLITDSKKEKLTLSFDEILELNRNGEKVKYTFEPIQKIGGTPISLFTYPSPLLDPFFQDSNGSQTSVTLLSDKSHIKNFEQALKIINDLNKAYYDAITSTVRGIYFYHGKPNSFATLSAHGIAFFNIEPENEVVFFVDDIVHQCGHIIFNTISFEKEKWFTVPPLSIVKDINPNSQDTEDLYSRYHGLFTLTEIVNMLDLCLEQKVFDGDQEYECTGRLVFNLTKFENSLENINIPSAYTEVGKEWYAYFKSTFERVKEKRKDLLSKFKVNNQPYVFKFSKFKEANQ